jgi:hypothetical protein
MLQINRTATFIESTTSSEHGFVPIADITVFHNERPLSNAERNSLKKPFSFCVFFGALFSRAFHLYQMTSPYGFSKNRESSWKNVLHGIRGGSLVRRLP